MTTKRLGQITDILMYALLLAQMMYVFIGNNVHEFLGIAFFVCLVIHIIIKRWWFKTLFKKKSRQRMFFDIVTILLLLTAVALMASSMGVSRIIFPWFYLFGSANWHRYLATALLTLAVLHGCMHFIMRTNRKTIAIVMTILACIASVTIGLFAVPYMNRHLRKVDITLSEKITGDTVDWPGSKPLVVYFSRVGNTDFEPDVDAVSGASLLIADGQLMGNDELLADMVCDIIGCEQVPITVTGQKYPSSYNDTISVAGDELRAQARPAIETIDVSAYDSVILIYPLWWGSIPMPVATFLEQNHWEGKTVYLIASQGSSGYGSTVSEIESKCPGAMIIPGTSIYCEDVPDARDELLNVIRGWETEAGDQ